MQILGLHVADFTLLVLYLLGIAGLGLWVSRSVRTEGDFFLGGRRFGKFFAIFHQFGTGTHADQPVAVTGKAHESGLAGIWYQWLWLFCTPFYWLLAPIFRRLRYVTTGDFFDRRYGAYLGQAYAVVGLAIFMLNIGIMLNGTGRIVESVTGGALSQLWAILLITLFFVVYAVVGGMVAAVITDAVQGMFIIVLSFILLPFVIAKAGGFTQLHQLLTPDKFSLVAPRDVTLFFIVMT
ncbi:MAG: sodium:solute symporter family protein, partial [Armatimonadetes bacterium]|nr:sodium:solute symporter family protein [Armatimonadota bacterium]